MSNSNESLAINFDWEDERWQNYQGSKLFEELCWELVDYEGYKDLEWRGDTHDRGRDLQANFIIHESGNKTRTEKWWFQCKRYTKSINVSDIGDAFHHAETENIDVFVIMSSSNLTNTFQEMIEKWNKNKSKPFRTRNWNYKTIEQLVKKHVHKFSNLDKYFDVNRSIERIREELSKREHENLEKAYDLKEKTEKRLQSFKNKPSSLKQNSLDKFIDSCLQIFEANLKNEAIDLLSSLAKIEELSDDIQYQIQLSLGDFYIKREWITNSIKHFARAAEKSSDKSQINKAKLKKGRALRLDNDFRSAKKELSDAYEYYKTNSKYEYYECSLELFKLYFEYEDLKEAEKFLNQISLDKGNIYFEKVLSEIRLFNKKRDWDSSIKTFEKLELEKFPYELRIQINLEIAFALFQQDNLDNAIDIIEDNCLPIVKEMGNEDRLMVLYQNITHLKNARQDKHDSFWESFNKWSNLYNKNLSEYHNASLKGLKAIDLTINRKFNQALDSLTKSKRIFTEVGSWNSLNKNDERKGYVYYKKEKYVKAIDYFIKSNSDDYLKKASEKLLLQKNSSGLNTLIKNYLSKQNLTLSEKIGFCHTINYLNQIIEEDIFISVTEKLSNLIFEKFSIDSNFDIKRPAIDAIKSSSYRIEKKIAEKLIRETYAIAVDDKSFWNVREKILSVYLNFEQIHPGIIPHDFVTELFELYTQTDSDLNDIVKSKLSTLLYQIAKTNNNLKGQLIEYYSNQETTNITLYYLINLDSEPDKKSVRKLLEKTTEIISNRVVVETEFDESSSNPSIEYSNFTLTSKRDNKRITVGSLPNLSFLFELDLSDYDQVIVNNLIESVINQINYFDNTVSNRINLLNLLANLSVDKKKSKHIVSFLWKVADNGLHFRSKDEREINWLEGKSNVNNLVTANVILGLTNNLEFIDDKYKFRNLVEKISLSQSLEIQLSVLEAFQKFDLTDEEIFLRYIILLSSSDDKIVSKCLAIINKELITKLSEAKVNTLTELLISLTSSFDNSITVLSELKEVFEQFLDLNFLNKYHQLIESKMKEFNQHRYYSVRITKNS